MSTYSAKALPSILHALANYCAKFAKIKRNSRPTQRVNKQYRAAVHVPSTIFLPRLRIVAASKDSQVFVTS